MTQAKGIWTRALQMLRAELNDFQYHVWMEPLVPLSMQGKTLILEAKSEMVFTTVYNTYIDLLREAVRNAGAGDVMVVAAEQRDSYLQDRPDNDDSNLFPRYTFDTFVVGSSNHFAHAVAQAVAANPGRAYNPFFLHSGVGLGKTHLMHAIGHYVKVHNPAMRVRYVTSETFTNEMIQSISSNRNQEFRDKYRNVDVLMVDDIQFLSKKEGTQEEFFHTFNTLYAADKQIIISSDKPPRAISQLEERLKTRFESGLIADIQAPNYETRMAILKRLSEHIPDVPIINPVLEYIAERAKSNIREIEGALNRVVADFRFKGKEITLENAAATLRDFFPESEPRKVDAELIKEIVAEYYKIDVQSLSAKRRDQEIAFPRQVAMYLCRTVLDLSYPQIGESFGGRNHTTVMHGCEKIISMLNEDKELPGIIEDIRKRLYE